MPPKRRPGRPSKGLIKRRQTDVAEWFGVAQATVGKWLNAGCPGQMRENDDGGPYDVREVARWLVRKRKIVVDAADGEPTNDDTLMSGSASPALERYRDERAKMAMLQRLQFEGRLVDVDQVSRCLMASAKMIRAAGDQLQRMFGVEAQRVLSEHLDEAERAVAEILSEYDDSTEDGQQ